MSVRERATRRPDPDGNEIEVFYELRREQWPDRVVAGGSRCPLPVDIEPVGVRG